MLHTFLTNFAAACQAGKVSILPTWYKYLNSETVAGKCTPLFDVTKDIPRILLAFVEIALFIGGVVSVGFIIFGGFQYMTSQGEPDKAKSGRTTIVNAIVGLIIASLASAVVNLIGRNLQ